MQSGFAEQTPQCRIRSGLQEPKTYFFRPEAGGSD